MGILNIGTLALQANQVALQTTGNNIANVNTPGYSRQTVQTQALPGQYTGAGYIGKGVSVESITRSYDAFLNRQSSLAGASQAADTVRAEHLKQLGTLFQGGAEGLGAAINDMMNAFSDVASTPADQTARTVLLTRLDEAARRMQAGAASLNDLQSGVTQGLNEKVANVNTLAKNIADLNDQVARALGSGQTPNDLLDRRDQLIRDLSKLVQTSQIAAPDGSIGVFIGASHPLVLGNSAATVAITGDDFGDPFKSKLSVTRDGTTIVLDENYPPGGEINGMLKFQNEDMTEARNLLGRITTAVTTAINDQHKLGLDLDGKVGTNLFTPVTFGSDNIRVPMAPANLNSANAGAGSLTMAIGDVTRFVASDYEISFSSATAGSAVRRSDGVATSFTFTPGSTTPPATRGTFTFAGTGTGVIDGLALDASTSAAPVAGDRFLLKPFSYAANSMAREFSTPRALAVANPVAATLTATNKGSLALSGIAAQTQASTAASPIDNFSVTFTVGAGGTSYSIVDNTIPNIPVGANIVVASQPYTSGQAIRYTPAGAPGFALTLSGQPVSGDSVTVKQNSFTSQNGGNATAMMNLRDVAMFDGAALTDGYAGMISTLGVRAQSADYSAQVSTNIAVNAEKDRAGLSGVNLDEEAAKLLQYQQAYQASAKMIQIAQSIFETLLQGLGR